MQRCAAKRPNEDLKQWPFTSQRISTSRKKKHQNVWWYNFTFAGCRIQESSKSARKTVAIEAEKNQRRELECSFNGIEDKRKNRIRSIREVADVYLKDYGARHKSETFAVHALGHVKRLVGCKLVAEITDRSVLDYQTARLKEQAAPKSINEVVGFLLRILEEQGDAICAKMRRQKTLKLPVRSQVACAFSLEEKAALIAEARKRRSPAIVPALMLALHAGMRDKEIRGLQWGRVDLLSAIVTVGDSKTDAGQDRRIPMNGDLLAALENHSSWYLNKFGEILPEWYVFPFGKPQPTGPTNPPPRSRRCGGESGPILRW